MSNNFVEKSLYNTYQYILFKNQLLTSFVGYYF